MENTKNIYLNKCKAFIDFMLKQQWSGLQKEDIDRWINNFKNVTEEEVYLIYKLLANLIYYSENDVLDVLIEGVKCQLFYSNVLEQQIKSGFQLSQNSLSQINKQELKKSCFIPLLDSYKPHESSNYISRQLVQNGIIEANQSMFPSQIVSYYEKTCFTNLIIVDDCVGSGHQIKDFWQYATVDENKTCSLRRFCAENNIKAKYLTLFGYETSINDLNSLFDDLKIICVRALNDTLRVFNENSYIWESDEEYKNALKFFSDYAEMCDVELYGYNDLDFAFIMHRTIPDWSLPLFWTDNANWKHLMRRKNSNGL